METILFRLVGIATMPFWLLMIFAPGRRWTEMATKHPYCAVAPIIIYAIAAGPHLLEWTTMMFPPMPEGVASVLGTLPGTTAAWAHFMGLDVLVGRAIYLDARAQGTSAWISSPLLAITCQFAPIGLGLYLTFRILAMVCSANRGSVDLTVEQTTDDGPARGSY